MEDNLLIHENKFLELAEKRSQNGLVVMGVSNFSYASVALNWAKAISFLGVDNYFIVSLDRLSYYYFRLKNIPTVLVKLNLPVSQSMGGWSSALAIGRMKLIYTLLKANISVVNSDTDAVWLKSPIPDFVDRSDADIVGSIVEHKNAWPPETREKWGFTICMGWIYIKSNRETIKLWENVISSFSDEIKCDQQALNHYLMNLKPQISETKLGHRRLLFANRLKIDGLSSSIVNRGGNIPNLYVCHPPSPKKASKKKQVLRDENLWVLDRN